jgi:hypothetical protein
MGSVFCVPGIALPVLNYIGEFRVGEYCGEHWGDDIAVYQAGDCAIHPVLNGSS